jgi:hypothetical protein
MPRNLARLGVFALLALLPSLFAAEAWLADLGAAKKQSAAEKEGLAVAVAMMNRFFKETGVTEDDLVRMTVDVRVGISSDCRTGDRDAVLKVVDEVATLTKSKEVLAEIADHRVRVPKVSDQDAERKKTQGK